MKKDATGGEGKAPWLFDQSQKKIVEFPKNSREIALQLSKNFEKEI